MSKKDKQIVLNEFMRSKSILMGLYNQLHLNEYDLSAEERISLIKTTHAFENLLKEVREAL